MSRPRLRFVIGCTAALAFALVVPRIEAAARVEGFQYVSPLPGARSVSPWNTIVIRHGAPVDAATLRSEALVVTGTRTGVHRGRLVLSDDGRTLVFNPTQPFGTGETVEVRLERGIRLANGEALPPLRFTFAVALADPKRSLHLDLDLDLPPGPDAPTRFGRESAPGLRTLAAACDTLPRNYRPVYVLSSDHPEPGAILLSPRPGAVGRGNLLIMDNLGMPLFYRDVPLGASNFAMQSNGLLTFFQSKAFMGMDSSYAVVDSFKTGNGYNTDIHELRVLSNGHALLMSYDAQPVGMDTVIVGGNPNATVIGLIVQEIDTAKNVVFQWRSWDHYQITDMDTTCVGSLRGLTVDYAHGNSIELDFDGNLLISSRNMNEITKVDRQTGDIIWRFGPRAKNNQFTVIGDAKGFSHQHDARRLPNGNLTLFDNGNCVLPQYSRGVEYQLDETNMIATQVWEFVAPTLIYGPNQGSVQRLPGGGTMIGWGGVAPDPKVIEAHADGSIALELGFANTGVTTYRALRSPWQTNQFATDLDTLDFGKVRLGSVVSLPLTVENPTATDRVITCFVSTSPEVEVQDPVPLVVPAGGSAVIQVRFAPVGEIPLDGTLYVRAVNDTELVARTVVLTGRGLANLPAASTVALGLLAGVLLVAGAWAARASGLRCRDASPESPGPA